MKQPRSRLATIISLLVALILYSCNQQVVFSHYEHIDIGEWLKSDTLTFTVSDIPDTASYQFQLGMRSTTDYPYTQLSLIAHVHTQTSSIDFVDTLHIDIADKKGNILGRGKSFFQYDVPMPSMQLNAGDTLTVSIRHNMRHEHLPGISEVGVTLWK